MAKTQVRTFRIPAPLWYRLDAFAKKNNVTKTSVLVEALENLLKKKGQ